MLPIFSIDFMIFLCRTEAGNKTFKEYCAQSLITFLGQCSPVTLRVIVTQGV